MARLPALVVQSLEALEPDVLVARGEVREALRGLPVDAGEFDARQQPHEAQTDELPLEAFMSRVALCLDDRDDVRWRRGRGCRCGPPSDNIASTCAWATHLSRCCCWVADVGAARPTLKVLHLLLVCVGMIAEVVLDVRLYSLLRSPLTPEEAADASYLAARLPSASWASVLWPNLPTNGIFADFVLQEPTGKFFVCVVEIVLACLLASLFVCKPW